MSAPVLRAPARVWRVAVAYLWLLGHRWTITALCVAFSYSWMGGRLEELDGSDGGPYTDIRLLAPLMFFLPILHWQGQGERPALEAALPLGRMRHALVRVGCGTAWAALTFGGATAIYLLAIDAPNPVPRTLGGYPPWYPLSLFAAGITLYLLGSAMLLGPRQPGRVLAVAVAVFMVAPGTWMRLLVAFQDPLTLAQMSAPEWLGRTALALGLACAAVYGAVRIELEDTPAWTDVVGRAVGARRPGLRPGLPLRSAPRPPVRPTRLRHPPSTLVVAWRRFVLLRQQGWWLVLIMLLCAWREARAQMAADRDGSALTDLTGPVYFSQFPVVVALGWPLLVWKDDRDQPLVLNEALPIGTRKKWILHMAAGAAWLLLAFLVLLAGRLGGAAAAGTLRFPAGVPAWLWLGLPCSALTLYFFGTSMAVLSRSPVRAVIVSFLCLWGVSVAWGQSALGDSRLAPLRAIAPFREEAVSRAFRVDWPAWDHVGAAFWLALWVAATAARLLIASAWDDPIDRPEAAEPGSG